MRFPERLKRTILVAPIDRKTEPVTYGEPVPYRVNVLSSSTDAMVEAYGIGYAERMVAVCDRQYGDAIREMDLVYVFTEPLVPEPPAEEEPLPEEPVPEGPTEEEPSEEEPEPAVQAEEGDGDEEPPNGDEPPAEVPEEPVEAPEPPTWDVLASRADFIVESKIVSLDSVRLVLVRREKSGDR